MKTPRARLLAILFLALATLPWAKFAQAQGEDNPTGITGMFNGNVATGCSYDPYTGNATRTIIDLTVPGAVGAYPLRWTRTMNSRSFTFAPFGAGGGWSAAYQWIAIAASGSSPIPTSYAVFYPDGRSIQFSASSKGDSAYDGPAGTSDRFQRASGNNTTCYLLLSDGGKVAFQQSATLSGSTYSFTFTPTQLIDPYGLITTLTTDTSGRVTQITEPAGRWLKITYTGDNITQVDAGYGLSTITQSVTYPYDTFGGYTVLKGATYSDGTSASYTYQASNMTPPPSPTPTPTPTPTPPPSPTPTPTPTPTPKCADVALTEIGGCRSPLLVKMTTSTTGAIIFYTKSIGTACRTPTHSGSTATGTTVGCSSSNCYVGVSVNTAACISALAYKSGLGDSTVTTIQADNVCLAPQTASSYIPLPLINTCSDVRYPGPMKNIAYDFVQGGSYGQLLREKYSGPTVVNVSTVTVTGATTRTETRGDTRARTFAYSGGMLTNWTDFKGTSMFQTRDANSYVNSFTDANSNTTNMTREAITGRITLLTHPPDVNGIRSSVIYAYKDPSNPYYLDHVMDELGHTTSYLRDANNRVYEIDYPDGGKETFTYDDVHGFNEVLTHGLTTGGTESFTYDTRGLKKTFTNADGKVTTYDYDTLDRVSAVHDPLSNITNLNYNERGQLIQSIYPPDPGDGLRHTVTNGYNDDGTLASVTDELGHVTSYIYDDYKRLKTVTTPQRFTSDTTPRTTTFWYDTAGTGVDDYTHTDANVTRTVLPSRKATTTAYDNNFWKTSVTVAAGTPDAATTTNGYDAAGNLKTVQDPRGNVTTSFYDARNRLIAVDNPIATDRNSFNHTISYSYDQAGNKLSAQRANNQLITYDSYDPMNRLTQQTVSQAPDPAAVTKYSYYPSGLLHTMQDPNLVALNSPYAYNYVYDLMGRKSSVTYPPDSSGATSSESYTYDAAGNLATFTNRAGNVQTFTYDNRNRQTQFIWNDGSTPSQTTVYDAASRVTQIANADATINFAYYDDNLLHTQSETTPDYADNFTRMVTYSYDADGNRASILYPSGANFAYAYTSRNQLDNITASGQLAPEVKYTYDLSGNRTTRALGNGTQTAYAPADPLNRITSLQHNFAAGATGRFDYAFDVVSRRTYEQRDSALTDGFNYDEADQVKHFVQNGTLSNGNVNGASLDQTIKYDASGNRDKVINNLLGTTTNYTANNLNQYSATGGAGIAYDGNGNLIGYNGWTYTYDAQNRLRSATATGATAQFSYDGLNRQIARNVKGNITINVWDGWDLLEEYAPLNALRNAYLHGSASDEMVERFDGTPPILWYYQDGRGNTSHLANNNGKLVEHYTYGIGGDVNISDGSGVPLTASAYNNRFLFSGRDYIKEIGLYDYRNRFYHPGLGRFLQPDPIGFKGDASNLYRYCGNNPANLSDPVGADAIRNDWGYRYVVHGGVGYVSSLATPSGIQFHVQDGHSWLQCAGAAQYLAGGYGANGNYYDVPSTSDWFQGASLTSATELGTLVAIGWQGGGYPSESVNKYQQDFPGSPVNHTAIFGGFDDGTAILYSQNPNGNLQRTTVSPEDQWQWNEVYVQSGAGPYTTGPSTATIVGIDSNTGQPIYAGRPVSTDTGSSAGFGPGSHGADLVNAFNMETALEGLGGNTGWGAQGQKPLIL